MSNIYNIIDNIIDNNINIEIHTINYNLIKNLH